MPKICSGEKILFKCDVHKCEKFFESKFCLKRHMKKHKTTKKFVCKICDKGFSLQQYLEEHTYTHTKEKPFICGVIGCHLTFRQRGKLSIHQKLDHGIKNKGKKNQLSDKDNDDTFGNHLESVPKEP